MKKNKLMCEINKLNAQYIEYRRKGDDIRAQQARDLADAFSKQLKNTHEV